MSLNLKPSRYANVLHAKGYHDTESKCFLRIWNGKTKAVVMFSEVEDNPGTSVTNISEVYANLAMEYVPLVTDATLPDEVVFIEHYPEDARGRYAEYFDRIVYDWSGGKAKRPVWSHLTVSDLRALGVCQ